MSESKSYPVGEYEKLLIQKNGELSDDWFMHEDIETLKLAFDEGKSAKEAFEILHGRVFEKHIWRPKSESPLEPQPAWRESYADGRGFEFAGYYYDGSEFGD